MPFSFVSVQKKHTVFVLIVFRDKRDFPKVKVLFLYDKLVSGSECLILSESVPLAKLHMRVTLRP